MDVTQADWEQSQRFDALFREHLAGIASYCHWRLAPRSGGEDAVAEVFLIAWRRLDDVPEEPEARAWLYATARRVMANQVRAEARQARLVERLIAQPQAAVEHEDPLTVRVHDALATLASCDREVLLLAEWEGLAPAEIARVIHCPAVTVRGRLFRARKRFRAAFGSNDLGTDAVSRSLSPKLSGCEP